METEKFAKIIEILSKLVWGSGTLALILGTGIFFTVKLHFFQFCRFPQILKTTIFALFANDGKKHCKNRGDSNSISQFRAISASLAASMGTGNIVGVAAALAIGGPGAIFWMWVSAFLGMSTAYAENYLGVYYYNKLKNTSRSVSETEKQHIKQKLGVGGAFLYFDGGLKSRSLTIFFAFICTLASFGIGNLTQANSISSALARFSVPPVICGTIFAGFAAFIIFRGTSSTLAVVEKILPFVTLFYLFGSVFFLIMHFFAVPECFRLIFASAFGIRQAVGGFSGELMKRSITCGMQKGVFSNEAGMGSSVFAHTSSDCKDPEVMGAWAVFEVFLDTIVCCTLTALVVLTSGVPLSSADPVETVIAAFETGFGSFASFFISVSICIFAFATLLSWVFYGERSVRTLALKKQKKENIFVFVYRLLYCIAIFIGCITLPDLIWSLSDILNGAQCIPNLAALLILSGAVKSPFSMPVQQSAQPEAIITSEPQPNKFERS